jgi:hypothetical protein
LQFGASNGGCRKVVAMEPQSKVQKLDHHDTGKLRKCSTSRNSLLRPFFPEAEEQLLSSSWAKTEHASFQSVGAKMQ